MRMQKIMGFKSISTRLLRRRKVGLIYLDCRSRLISVWRDSKRGWNLEKLSRSNKFRNYLKIWGKLCLRNKRKVRLRLLINKSLEISWSYIRKKKKKLSNRQAKGLKRWKRKINSFSWWLKIIRNN